MDMNNNTNSDADADVDVDVDVDVDTDTNTEWKREGNQEYLENKKLNIIQSCKHCPPGQCCCDESFSFSSSTSSEEEKEMNICDRKKIICRNCGKSGHKYKECYLPIISYGIICLNWMVPPGIVNITIEDIVNISKVNSTKTFGIYDQLYNDEYQKWVDIIESHVKILMVMRKHSLGFMDFIRGKYQLDNKGYIMILINSMTNIEKSKIIKYRNKFSALWCDIWSLGKTHRPFGIENEYLQALLKFDTLQNKYDIHSLIEESGGNWETPEWGFPKGRRNFIRQKDNKKMGETDWDCAKREFIEETGFELDDFKLLNLKTLFENFTSINKENYKHIYYVAESKRIRVGIDERNVSQTIEIGDIKWVSYKEAMSLIRNYQISKKKVLEYLFNHLKNIMISHYFSKIE